MQVLHIGDSLACDFCGARAAGFQASSYPSPYPYPYPCPLRAAGLQASSELLDRSLTN